MLNPFQLMKTYFSELKDSELESVLMILDADGNHNPITVHC